MTVHDLGLIIIGTSIPGLVMLAIARIRQMRSIR